MTTQHRHKDSRGQWTTLVTDPDFVTKADLTALGGNVTSLTTLTTNLSTAVALLNERLTAAGIPPAPVPPVIVPVPPVTPPPPPPPTGPPPDMAQGAFQALLNAASPGATVDIPFGRYHELVTFAKPGLFRVAPGSLIDGDNIRTEYVRIAAPGVEVWDLGTVGAKVGAHQAGSFSTSGVGQHGFIGRRLKLVGGQATILKFQDSHTHRFIDCDISGGPESLFSFNKADDIQFIRGKLHDALGTLPGFNQGDEGGAGKLGGYAMPEANSGSTMALFDGVEVFNIVGKGLWADIKGNNLTIRNCRIHDVEREGGMFEISAGALFEDNVIYGCGRTGPSWGYGAGVLASSSRSVIFRRNLLYDCARGLMTLSQRRISPAGYDFNPGVAAIEFSDNTVIAKNAADEYMAGAVSDWPDPAFWQPGAINYFGNRYWHPSGLSSPNRFVFTTQLPVNGQYQHKGYSSIASFAALFGDKTSRMLSDAEKANALAAANVPM